MKPGTDALLLAGLIDEDHSKPLLDVGSGTGIISLLLAQRGFSHIHCIEPDESAFLEGKLNIENSPYFSRIKSFNQKLQEFTSSQQYHTIISNPPFHIGTASPQGNRNKARNATELPLSDFFKACKRLLTKEGSAYLILPYPRKQELLSTAQIHGYSVAQNIDIQGIENQTPKRIICKIKRGVHLNENQQFCIRKEDNSWHDDYLKACADFHHPSFFKS